MVNRYFGWNPAELFRLISFFLYIAAEEADICQKISSILTVPGSRGG